MAKEKYKQLSNEDISDLLLEIDNTHTKFEKKYKNILEKYQKSRIIESSDFIELFNLSESYYQYNLPYSLFTKLIFEIDANCDLSDFAVELKRILKKIIVDKQNNEDVYGKDRKKARIIAKVIEHTELAVRQKDSLYGEQKAIIDELTTELNNSNNKINELNNRLEESSNRIKNLTKSVNSHKFDLIALMSVVFTIFTVLGVNTSIISALATIKELKILEMIGLFVFGNVTLTLMIWFIMFYSKKYYMDFIHKR